MFLFLVAGNPANSVSQMSTPISQSFQSIKKCYPDLASSEVARSEITGSLELGRLKDKIDHVYFTTKSALRYRKMSFEDLQKDTKRLTIRRTNSIKNHKFEYEMILEKIDEKGMFTDIEIPVKHRKNPKQADINTYILNSVIKKDETSFIDTKLNGFILTYQRNFLDVVELELRDSRGLRTLTCENQKNLGVVCTCK